jgi:peptidoglycan biosynthesis protein MviN/MurJ (putative lipid II flippase)
LKSSLTPNTDYKKNSHLQLGRIVISLSVITIIAKVFGFAEKIVIVHSFGTDVEFDVYFALMGIVLSAAFMVRELIYPSLLPILSRAIHEQNGAASNLIRKIFICAVSILLMLCIALFVFPDFLTAILLPGFTGNKFVLTSKILRFLSPAIFFSVSL